jgi:hypothetical protein
MSSAWWRTAPAEEAKVLTGGSKKLQHGLLGVLERRARNPTYQFQWAGFTGELERISVSGSRAST